MFYSKIGPVELKQEHKPFSRNEDLQTPWSYVVKFPQK